MFYISDMTSGDVSTQLGLSARRVALLSAAAAISLSTAAAAAPAAEAPLSQNGGGDVDIAASDSYAIDADIPIDPDRAPYATLRRLWDAKAARGEVPSFSERRRAMRRAAHSSRSRSRTFFLQATAVLSPDEQRALGSRGGWCAKAGEDYMERYVMGDIADFTYSATIGVDVTSLSASSSLFSPQGGGNGAGDSAAAVAVQRPPHHLARYIGASTRKGGMAAAEVKEEDTIDSPFAVPLSASTVRESFVARIVSPAPNFVSADGNSRVGILEHIEASCGGHAREEEGAIGVVGSASSPIRRSPLSVAATFFGSSSVMLHGTPRAIRECLSDAHAALNAHIVSLCHWHGDVVFHPELQAALVDADGDGADEEGHFMSPAEAGVDLSSSPDEEAEALSVPHAVYPFEHIVAVVPPLPGSALSDNEDTKLKSHQVEPLSTLAAHYNSPALGLEVSSGYRFVSNALSNETRDDYIRHFICEGRGPAVDSSHQQQRAFRFDYERQRFSAQTNSPFFPQSSSFLQQPLSYAHCSLPALLRFLAAHVAPLEGLTTVEARRVTRVANKFSRGLLESGKQYEEPFGKGLGLRGEGYVVAVSDTGVDYDHCFFRDPARGVPLNRADPQHRKIVRYQTIGSNQGDFSPGHGTHVAGTIAGSPIDAGSEFADFHGVLPKAKLVVWDQSLGSGEGLRGVGNYNDFFGVSYTDGARVHSNSWGSAGASYSFDASAIDGYTSNTNRYILPIFAAGNDADSKCGNTEDDLYCDRRTVISPCIAKNVLCVGASMGSYDSWKYAKLGNYIMRVPAMAGDEELRVLKGNFGPTDPSALASVEVVLADPFDGCVGTGALRNADLKGKLVVFSRGTCTFVSKILAAQRKGAAGALIVNNVNGDAIIMGCDDPGDCGIHIGSFMIDKDTGFTLKAHVAAAAGRGERAMASVVQTDAQDPHKGEDNLSEFSSHGPTADNRYKPEVVAVGELVINAFSDANLNSNNCDVWPTQGTSMATPLTSGLATMLLQYFQLGIHIDGSRSNKAKGLAKLTSSMLKAAIIHAATPLTGVFDRNSRGDWRQLGRAPTSEQGHGKPRLNESYPSSPNSPIRVFLDDASSVDNGGAKEYCIDYNGLAPGGFTATLAWIDPAASSGALYVLVSDLNLVVTTPDGGREFHGNMDPIDFGPSVGASDVRTAGASDGFDVLNNNEKVRIPRAPAGTYRVRVDGANLPKGAQHYSLIVSGTQAATCPAFCQLPSASSATSSTSNVCVHGVCAVPSGGSPPRCRCDEGWGGPRCDVPQFTVPQSSKTAATLLLEPMQWVYFAVPPLLPPTAGATAVSASADLRKFIVHPKTRDGEIDFALCAGRASSNLGAAAAAAHGGCVQRDTQCQTCGTKGPPATPSALTVDASKVSATERRVLGVTAQCCYRAEVTISSPSASRAAAGGGAEIVAVADATHTRTSSSSAFSAQQQQHVYMLELAVEGAAALFADGPSGGSYAYFVALRSSEWSVSSSAGANLSYHECAVTTVDSQKGTVTCTVSTDVCGGYAKGSSSALNTTASYGPYFSIALARRQRGAATNAGGRTVAEVLSAPHPSAVHVRCSAFRELAASSPTTTTEVLKTTTAVPTTTTTTPAPPTLPPMPAVPPTLAGLRGPSGSLTRKLIVPRSAAGGRVYTLGGSGFAAAKGRLKIKMTAQTASTDTVADTQVHLSGGTFVEFLPPPMGNSDGVLQFSMPPEVAALADVCNAMTERNCGLVRVLVNLVFITGNGNADTAADTFIGDVTVFLASAPRIDGLGVEPVQSNEPFSLVLEPSLTLPAPIAAQYNDQNYFDSSTIFKAERWFYFKGRFLSDDPRASLAFGALLEGAALVPSTTADRLVRFKTPSSSASSSSPPRYTYCGILTPLNDELLECMTMLSSIERSASAVSTALPLEARFPGDGEAVPQQMAQLWLGPSGVVYGLADEIGAIVPEPRVSPYLALTIIGKAFPVEYTHLLVITARPLGLGAAVGGAQHALEVLAATPERLIVRFGGGVAARAGQYELSVSLTTRVPLSVAAFPLRFSFRGSEASTHLTGLSLDPSSTAADAATAAATAPTADLRLPSRSSGDAPHVLRLHGVNIGALLAAEEGSSSSFSSSSSDPLVVVRLTCLVELVEEYERCEVDPSLSTPTSIACRVSPFASHTCAVEALVGQHLAPLLSLVDGRPAQLRVTFGGPPPPYYATAFSFDTVLLVGAVTRAEVIGADMGAVWSQRPADREANAVGVFVSATPCYRPMIIGTSRIVTRGEAGGGGNAGDDDAIAAFDIVATSMTQSVAHVCLANGIARGVPTSSSSSSPPFIFYTRVSLDVVVVSPALVPQAIITPSSASATSGTSSVASVGLFDASLRFVSSLEGDFVNRVFVYAGIGYSNESCGVAMARRGASESLHATAEAHWHISDGGAASPFLEAEVDRIAVPSSALAQLASLQRAGGGGNSGGGIPRLCVALSTNINDVHISPHRFVPLPAATGHLGCGASGLCGGRGQCSSSAFSGGGKSGVVGSCQCDAWFGGDYCSTVCEAPRAGAPACGGFACRSGGICDCGDAVVVSRDGSPFRPRGPSCGVLAQQVAIAPYIAPTTDDGNSGGAAAVGGGSGSLPRGSPFVDAPTYYPPSVANSHPSSSSSSSSAYPTAVPSSPSASPLLDPFAAVSSSDELPTSSSYSSVPPRAVPIVLELTNLPSSSKKSLMLDVIVITPPAARSVAVRLHRNDSRLLHPTGAVHVYSLSRGLSAPAGSNGGGAASAAPEGSVEAALVERSVAALSFPLSGDGWSCLLHDKKSDGATTVGAIGGAGSSCFIVVEVSTDATALEGSFASAAVGLKLRDAAAESFSSIARLAARGVLGTDEPKRVRMERLDTSSFIAVFSLMGVAVSVVLGAGAGFVVMARRKLLVLGGPKLMFRSVVSALCCCFSCGSGGSASGGGLRRGDEGGCDDGTEMAP